MLKKLAEMLNIKNPFEKAIAELEEQQRKRVHPIDWVNDGQPFEKECYYLVGEPVLTLLDSLKARPNRFKIYRMKHEEYVKSRKEHADTYMWMKNGCRFFKFVDKVSGISHTAVVSDGKLYRVDDLPFNLNHWELKVIIKGFIVARQPSVDRIAERRRRRLEAEREAIEQAEMIARHIYMENLK